MRNLTMRSKVFVLLGMFVATLVAISFVGPIPQDPDYHNFADMRPLFGIPNFGDVLSNIGFAIVGIIGLVFVLSSAAKKVFAARADSLPYVIFFIGVALVGLGSGYYHLSPDNDSLFWDRLPMTVAFMALFSAIIADRIDRTVGITWLLPILIALGAASLFYWDWTESLGRGDLRFYGLVQFYPIIALPVICWMFPRVRYTEGRSLAWVIFWYLAAKVLEHFDGAVLSLLGETISGHSLKHLAAAMATYCVLRMIKASPKIQQGES